MVTKKLEGFCPEWFKWVQRLSTGRSTKTHYVVMKKYLLLPIVILGLAISGYAAHCGSCGSKEKAACDKEHKSCGKCDEKCSKACAEKCKSEKCAKACGEHCKSDEKCAKDCGEKCKTEKCSEKSECKDDHKK
jgi:hypothetical protein